MKLTLDVAIKALKNEIICIKNKHCVEGQYCDACQYEIDDEDFVDVLNFIIPILEKQERKPARAKFIKRYNRFVYFCPVCGEVTGHYDYCSDCGQALDYDNVESHTEGEA